ncbi:NAD(P)-binding protein [Auricularia subglabra TFB-10046 SS5]|nr:NAD(P)-binding protein [Auricularia subglabra TFB-10046 SS5]
MAHTIRTVVVHGATGLQGGTVTRALSAAGYHVRAAVRDVNAPKARELAKLPNVEHAPIDLSNIQKLIKTYTGADAVFACSVPGPDELQHGKNMADAAKAAGVKFYIWSALESIEKLTKGTANLKVPEFDNKAEVADYVSALGIPYTNLYLGGFMESQSF